jgi:hypothetical protein
MKKVQSIPLEICPKCGLEESISSEFSNDRVCVACDTSLNKTLEVEYNDHCPICEKSFEEEKPTAFHQVQENLMKWLCSKCKDSPRGIFIEEYEFFEKEAPQCNFCDNESNSIFFTPDNEEGDYLCQSCASSEVGNTLLKHHQKIFEEF